MDTAIPRHINIERNGETSVCRITLERDVEQAIERRPVRAFQTVNKLYDKYDVSLLIGNIFGNEVLDTAEVTEGGEVLRGFGSRSLENSLTTVNFRVGNDILKVEFQTESRFAEGYPTFRDTDARKVITISARNDIITGMIEHHEFLDICDALVSKPAAKYKPKIYEVVIDLGRQVFQPLAGTLIGDINAQGDVIMFMKGIFGEKISGSFEIATEVARRSPEEGIGTFTEYHGVKVSQLGEPRELQSSRISACNYVRVWTFKVDGGIISARFETPKAKDPDPLPDEEAAARRIIKVRGPKHLMERVPGYGGMEALCHELSVRDIAQISSMLVMTATIPPRTASSAPRYGPRFPRRTEGFGVMGEGQPCFRDGISVPPQFRDRNERPFGAPIGQGLQTSRWSSRPAPRQPERRGSFTGPQPANPPKPQSKPPGNVVEGVASLTMARPPRRGYDRLGKRRY